MVIWHLNGPVLNLGLLLATGAQNIFAWDACVATVCSAFICFPGEQVQYIDQTQICECRPSFVLAFSTLIFQPMTRLAIRGPCPKWLQLCHVSCPRSGQPRGAKHGRRALQVIFAPFLDFYVYY